MGARRGGAHPERCAEFGASIDRQEPDSCAHDPRARGHLAELPELGIRVSPDCSFRSRDSSEQDVRRVIVALRTPLAGLCQVGRPFPSCGSRGGGGSIDRQGDRTPLARNFIAGAGDLSRYRAGLEVVQALDGEASRPSSSQQLPARRGESQSRFGRIALRPIRRYRRV